MQPALTFSEAAQKLKVTYVTIDYWIRRYGLDHFRCQSGYRFFSQQQFEAFRKFRADRLARPIQRGRKRKASGECAT